MEHLLKQWFDLGIIDELMKYKFLFKAYVCQCPTGYYGTCCESRNYCMPNPCANNGLCTQTTTGYICSCLYPYTGTNCQQSMLIFHMFFCLFKEFTFIC